MALPLAISLGLSVGIRGEAEPDLLAVDHENQTMRLLASILGRAVRLFAAGGKVGKFALQRRKIGWLLGRAAGVLFIGGGTPRCRLTVG